MTTPDSANAPGGAAWWAEVGIGVVQQLANGTVHFADLPPDIQAEITDRTGLTAESGINTIRTEAAKIAPFSTAATDAAATGETTSGIGSGHYGPWTPDEVAQYQFGDPEHGLLYAVVYEGLPLTMLSAQQATDVKTHLVEFYKTHADAFDTALDGKRPSVANLITTVQAKYDYSKPDPSGAVTTSYAESPYKVPNEKNKSDVASSLTTYAQQLGIDPASKDVALLIQQAQKKGWTQDKFLLELRKTDTYDQRFPEIDITKGVTEADYIAQEQANPLASVRGQLKDWGIPMTQEVRDAVENRIGNPLTAKQIVTRTLSEVKKTKEYQQRFAGKPANMSEDKYIQTERAYQDAASRYGIHIGAGPAAGGDFRMRYLFQNNISPSEFGDRAEAMAKIRDNPQMFQQFTAVLSSRGLLKAGQTGGGAGHGLDPSHLLKFVMGQGDAAWHQAWQETMIDNAALQAGVAISPGTGLSLTRGQIRAIASTGVSPEQAQAGFSQFAKDFLSIMPLSEAAKYGITKQDILTADLGGPGAAEAVDRMTRAQAQAKAYGDQQRVKQGIREGQDGGITAVGGPSQRAQSI